MSDQSNRDFHLARSTAERAAATNAASELTRALHLQLADLHADLARSVKPQQEVAEVIQLAARRGMLVRTGLSDGLSDSARPA